METTKLMKSHSLGKASLGGAGTFILQCCPPSDAECLHLTAFCAYYSRLGISDCAIF